MNLKLNFGTGKKMTKKQQIADLIKLHNNAHYEQLSFELQCYWDYLIAIYVV